VNTDSTITDDLEDADVPEQALAGLRAAQERARQTGHPMVLVRDGKLIRVQGDSVVVLKDLPGWKRVRPPE
jgi:hypothetical protein